MKNSYKLSLAIFSIASLMGLSSLKATDSVGQESGVVREMVVSRWLNAKVGQSSATFGGTTAITNVISSTSPIVIGKIFFVPAHVSDTLKLYAATSGAGASDANLMWDCNLGISPTFANTPTQLPAVFDNLPGMTSTNGLTAIYTRGSTPTTGHAYINYDTQR